MHSIKDRIILVSRHDTNDILPELYEEFKGESYAQMGSHLISVCKHFLSHKDHWLSFYAELLGSSYIARLEYLMIWFYSVAEYFQDQELAILLYLLLWKLDNAIGRAQAYLERKNTDLNIYELAKTSLATCKKIHREICKNRSIQLVLSQMLSENLAALGREELTEFLALQTENLILPLVVQEPEDFRVNIRYTSTQIVGLVEREYSDSEDNFGINYNNVPIDSKERLEELMQLQNKYNPRYRNMKRAR